MLESRELLQIDLLWCKRGTLQILKIFSDFEELMQTKKVFFSDSLSSFQCYKSYPFFLSIHNNYTYLWDTYNILTHAYNV